MLCSNVTCSNVTRRTFVPLLALGASVLKLRAQAPGALPAIPKETLPPVLTPWEVNTTTGEFKNSAFPGHHVIGNIYYVGTSDYASFLITSDQGHILLNPDFEDSVDIIKANVEKLGFRFQDIKVILISHAHGDHCAGTAKAKEMTGAQVTVMEQDADLLEHATGGRGSFPQVHVNRILHDNDEVKVGASTLVARLTPGHTRGCTSWVLKTQDAGKTYNVVIIGSIGVNNAMSLVNNKNYPNIVADYQRSFQLLKSLPCDVFLASHASFYGLAEKYKKLQSGGANPFIDPAGYKAHVALMEKAFYYKLDWAMRQA
jgi:metallo-beta-lactamase class B